ncbi:MAG TPA: zinc metalloprotease HtpX [Ktedonobacterales bacterium]|nr:zinc metalloprotease HtpX [Ktedonobacterales bacterium]
MSGARPSWYKPDVGLSMRMVLTIFLLGAVYVVFGVVLAFVAHVPMPLLIAIAALIAFAQFFYADKIALFSMRAREVSEAEAPQLHEMIGRLAAQANLPKPRVALVDTSVPNAFATGRSKNHAVVAVTTGIINKLEPQELEAVLAHELTHIINRDMLVMTIAAFFSIVAGLIVRNFFWFGGGFGGGYGRRNNNNGGDAFAIILLVSLAVYAVSFLLIRALSRYRELAADRGSALITGDPSHLASALMHISNDMQRIPDKDFRQAQTVNALWIVPALRGNNMLGLLSTHPSTEERVARLQQMQLDMEKSQRF